MGIEKQLKREVESLIFDSNIDEVIMFLSIKKAEKNSEKDYSKHLEKSLDFLNRADVYLKYREGCTTEGHNILNSFERDIVSKYLSKKEELNELRTSLLSLSYGLEIEKDEIEKVLNFYHKFRDYSLEN